MDKNIEQAANEQASINKQIKELQDRIKELQNLPGITQPSGTVQTAAPTNPDVERQLQPIEGSQNNPSKNPQYNNPAYPNNPAARPVYPNKPPYPKK
jgi:hypothetical protein